MRIITGIARGCTLQTLEGDDTRPTPERVKEAIFSSLQFDIEDKTFLDLFSGSGQMGLEAVSRGAKKAYMNDASSAACAVIKANAQKCRLFDKCVIMCRSWPEYLKCANGKEKYDYIYLDPPYAEHLLPDVLDKILKTDVLCDGAVIICESEHEDICDGNEDLKSKFAIKKHTKYGRVHITYIQKEV